MITTLYIEDDALQREVTEKLYRTFNNCFFGDVKFLAANDWPTGLKIMQCGSVDVAIVDLTLPPMSKDDTLAVLRSTPNLPPVVIFTGNEYDLGLRRECILAGADDFILKSEVRRHPELLCERVYVSYLRRNRAAINGAELSPVGHPI